MLSVFSDPIGCRKLADEAHNQRSWKATFLAGSNVAWNKLKMNRNKDKTLQSLLLQWKIPEH
jgi:hypothetical protein